MIENGDLVTPQTVYIQDAAEVFGTTGDQTEEFAEENKSVIWFLMKQVLSSPPKFGKVGHTDPQWK